VIVAVIRHTPKALAHMEILRVSYPWDIQGLTTAVSDH
jgi:hypothetical protein